ncbi:hypothetical protein JR316_0001412 [Psilocybe cubensis]|uniref:Uncharacterized protein n=2 Tax=Psilocybe cubensis TaxID=181762 RepID=A0A8H8CR59_PSICU|nr:hypothetical protein JR316_0001412 [Psilocybe cubensis]KAH9487338.1 hypothetical protein JR316_0001412 [Psilocybe cubensis]
MASYHSFIKLDKLDGEDQGPMARSRLRWQKKLDPDLTREAASKDSSNPVLEIYYQVGSENQGSLWQENSESDLTRGGDFRRLQQSHWGSTTEA